MKRFTVVLILAFFIQVANCQDKDTSRISILFQGLVFDAATLKPVPNTQILVNRAFASVSDDKGVFALYVKLKDTVVFRNLGYKQTSVIIGDSLAQRQYVAGIYLRTDTLEIGEVIIVPRMGNLKSEILNTKSKMPAEMENARYNVAVSAYQGRTSAGKLGDPASNYDLLRQRQKVDAYEKGQIPSDRIAGLSPFLLLPAAYLLIHGMPQKTPAMKPDISDYELDQIMKKYEESLKSKVVKDESP
jgi:hypothetical protein